MASLILRVHAKASGAKRVPKNRAKEVKKEIQNIMRKIGNVGVNNIRSEIKKRRLQKTGEMFKSVTYSMTPQGVRFTVDSPAPYLETGIRQHTMKHLLNSKGPIPIQVDEMNTIFRWATKESMDAGGWKHPGFKRGKGFMSSAIQRTRRETAEDFNTIASKIFKP